MGARGDPTLCGLTVDLGQSHNRHRTGSDHVGQNLPRTDGRELINVTHDQQGGMVGNRPQQRLHQQNIDHGGLVDDQQVAF